jgi:hypothetical protein
VQLDPNDIVNAVLAFCGPPLYSAVFMRMLRGGSYFGGWIGGCALEAIVNVLDRQYLAAVTAAASLIIAAVLWWLSRRRRKRAPKLAGAKSRALLAAVVRTMRERSKPRPVFRPVPGRV